MRPYLKNFLKNSSREQTNPGQSNSEQMRSNSSKVLTDMNV